MQRKNKIMIAAAIGAVVVLVVSGIVRAAVSTASDHAQQATDVPAIEQTAQAANNSSEGVPSGDASTLALLQSHAWQVQGDAKKTVVFRDGSFVETDGASTRVTAFSVTSEETTNAQHVLYVKLIRDGLSSDATSIIVVDGTEGSYTLTCDAFQVSKSYVQGKANAGSVKVNGLDDAYTALIDNKTTELQSAIAAYAANHVPTAKTAVFDGEVYLDTSAKRVSATFHADDAAHTILTVTYASGIFTVAG